MTVLAKELCAFVYGEAPQYSYITGLSAGGRQTLNYIRLYPKDYDGAWDSHAANPWHALFISCAWPYVVMNNEKPKILPAKFEALRNAVLKKHGCEELDYVNTAYFPEIDPYELVGIETSSSPIKGRDAEIFKKIYDGPTYSNGKKIPQCEPYTYGTRIWKDMVLELALNKDGSVERGIVMIQGDVWVTRNPDFKIEEVTYEDLNELYDRGMAEFAFCDGIPNNMDAFRDAGGKPICTASTGDGAVPPKFAVNYYNRMLQYFGDEEEMNDFFRLFLAYGGPHGIMMEGVYGEQSGKDDCWKALMHWFEDGVAPEEITTITWDSEKQGSVHVSAAKRHSFGKILKTHETAKGRRSISSAFSMLMHQCCLSPAADIYATLLKTADIGQTAARAACEGRRTMRHSEQSADI